MKLLYILVIIIIIFIFPVYSNTWKKQILNILGENRAITEKFEEIKNSLIDKTKYYYDSISDLWKNQINKELININKNNLKNINNNNLSKLDDNILQPIINDKYYSQVIPSGVKDDNYNTLKISDDIDYEYTKVKSKKYDYPKFKNNKIPNKINDEDDEYNYFSIAYNQYYDQFYLLYEKEFVDKNEKININDIVNTSHTVYDKGNITFNNINVNPDIIDSKKTDCILSKLYQYLLVKVDSKMNTTKIIHKVAPRMKIEMNDTVYFSYGEFELGPLVIRDVKL